MTAELCGLIALGLAVCGVVIACATGKRRRGRKRKGGRRTPPSLPPRVNVGTPPPASHSRTPAPRSANPRPLPARRSPVSANVDASRGAVRVGLGPRGLKPEQFPCCPYDKQRNVPGSRQVIFWDGGESCYRCSRGHRFKANGKLM